MILCSHSFAAFHTFILCAYLVKFCARLYCWKYHSITGTFTTSSIIIMKYTASVGRCGQKAAVSARGGDNASNEYRCGENSTGST